MGEPSNGQNRVQVVMGYGQTSASCAQKEQKLTDSNEEVLTILFNQEKQD